MVKGFERSKENVGVADADLSEALASQVQFFSYTNVFSLLHGIPIMPLLSLKVKNINNTHTSFLLLFQ